MYWCALTLGFSAARADRLSVYCLALNRSARDTRPRMTSYGTRADANTVRLRDCTRGNSLRNLDAGAPPHRHMLPPRHSIGAALILTCGITAR